jgi:hypothetical protein
MISAGPELHVYDIAKSKVRKSFSLKSNITSFAVNHCDAYIAAGCSDGSLNLVIMNTNQVVAISFVLEYCNSCLYFQFLISPFTLQTLLHGDEESERNHRDLKT